MTLEEFEKEFRPVEDGNNKFLEFLDEEEARSEMAQHLPHINFDNEDKSNFIWYIHSSNGVYSLSSDGPTVDSPYVYGCIITMESNDTHDKDIHIPLQ